MLAELLREVDDQTKQRNHEVLSIVCERVNRTCRYRFYLYKAKKLSKYIKKHYDNYVFQCQRELVSKKDKLEATYPHGLPPNIAEELFEAIEACAKWSQLMENLKVAQHAMFGETACGTCVACLGIDKWAANKIVRGRRWRGRRSSRIICL